MVRRYSSDTYDGDEIDVKATDDKTLVATLNAPCAYFLDLAAFPAFYPVPQAAVEAADPTGIRAHGLRKLALCQMARTQLMTGRMRSLSL